MTERAVQKNEINITPFVDVMLVSLHENGVIYVGSERLGETQGTWLSLPAMLRSKSSGDFSRPVYVRADQAVGYGDVVRLIDELINEDVVG